MEKKMRHGAIDRLAKFNHTHVTGPFLNIYCFFCNHHLCHLCVSIIKNFHSDDNSAINDEKFMNSKNKLAFIFQ